MKSHARLLALGLVVGAVSASVLERLVRADGPARVLAQLSPEEQEALPYTWKLWARPEQLAPAGDWRTWLVLAGRGFGKTRTGAEFVRDQVLSGRWRFPHLVARTAADVRDVMVEGESGLLAVHPPDQRPKYEPSKRRLTWPNGAVGVTFTAEKPDALRGPQCDGAWADELASWQYPDAWDQLQFGLRLGRDPRVIVTTTPRPVRLIRNLIADPTTRVTGGSTYENRANLAKAFLEAIIKRFEGTRQGDQELLAKVLDGVPGALWERTQLEADRVRVAPELRRIVIAVDPAVSSNEGSDLTGIIVVGLATNEHAYVLADFSGRYSPLGWGRVIASAFERYEADMVVGEVNQGGDLVKANLRAVAPGLPFKAVHASRGKAIRAEPASALYEQHRVHHVQFVDMVPEVDPETDQVVWRAARVDDVHLADLEDQLCSFTPDLDRSTGSPDRADALVYGLRELIPVLADEPKQRKSEPDPLDLMAEREERRRRLSGFFDDSPEEF